MASSAAIIAATLAENGAAFYVAPLGTALPTDATTKLDAKYQDLGWCGPDGFRNAIKRSTTKHKAFGGEVVKTTQDEYLETFTAELLETTANVLKVVHGDNAVTGTGDKLTVEHSPLMLGRKIFVIEFIDGDRIGRHVLREAQVTEIADIPYQHDQLTKYGLTIDTFKPSGAKSGVVTYYDKKAATLADAPTK